MKNFFLFILVFLVAITWSTTWIATKFTVSTIPALFATGLRFLISAPLLILLAYIQKIPILGSPNQRFFQFIVSIFYFTIPFACMIYSGKYIKLSFSSVIFSNMPIFILLISSLINKKKINKHQIFGIILSFISLISLFTMQWKNFNIYQEISIFLLFFVLLCHSSVYVFSKKKYPNISILSFNGLPSLFAGLFLTGIGWITEKPVISSFSLKSILSLFYLSIFVSIFGILSYFYLQKKIGELYSSTIFIIFPIISLFIEQYFYKSVISTDVYFYIILCLIGSIISLFSTKKNINIKKKILNFVYQFFYLIIKKFFY